MLGSIGLYSETLRLYARLYEPQCVSCAVGQASVIIEKASDICYASLGPELDSRLDATYCNLKMGAVRLVRSAYRSRGLLIRSDNQITERLPRNRSPMFRESALTKRLQVYWPNPGTPSFGIT